MTDFQNPTEGAIEASRDFSFSGVNTSLHDPPRKKLLE
jgi:hypothetical protein